MATEDILLLVLRSRRMVTNSVKAVPHKFLADRTNGRAYATMKRPSSVCLYGMFVAKRCILEQNLLLTAYRKSYDKLIGTKMNGLDLCLEVVSRSCQRCVTFDVEYLRNRKR